MNSRGPLAIAILCLATLIPAIADDTDILLSGVAPPNVLILLDSSGSMNDEIDGVDKIVIAKQVVTNLISSTSNVRFGVMKFRSNGAELVAPIGTDAATMVTAVNAMTTTSVGTPLGDMLYDAGEYFHGNLTPHLSPIDLTCRLNIIIVVSDGLENTNNRDLVDEATLRRTQDHSVPLAGSQNVIVHTIGFGIDPSDAAAANDILEEAADNGSGSFFSTENAAELQNSLESTISAVIADTYSFAAAVVPSTSVTGSDRAFQASFLSDPVRPFWRGYLGAYQRDATGAVPTDAGGVPLSSALVWEAGDLLRLKSAASRTIYTAVGGTRQAFTTANALITPGLLGVGTAGERNQIIDFIRGVDTFDEDGDTNVTEQRQWKLGDVLHSSPVMISPPVLLWDDPDYQAFKQDQAGRTVVLAVGANDGMLHAFRESDGQELWAFIPPDLLGSLGNLTPSTGAHPYYVDSSPVAADIKIADAFKTILIIGERRGGRGYHALDVTDTTNPGYLWSFTDARIGETWSIPVVGRIKVADGTERYVAFVGGGYDTPLNNNTGKAFFAIDLESGTKLWEYYNDGSTDDRQRMNYSLAARPTAIDLDGNGYIDRVYAGDVGGQLWKFDTSAEATFASGLINNWLGKRLFTAAPAQANPPPAGAWEPLQAIYGAVAPALDAAGALWVYFGTGDLNHPSNPSQNYFYGVRDDTGMTNGANLDPTDLFNVTSTNGSGGNGWYFLLTADQKVLASADVFGGSVFFSGFTPPGGAFSCAGVGTATLYAVEMSTGYGSLDWSTGEELPASDSSDTRSVVVGTGIPSGPGIVTTVNDGVLDTNVITATSDEQLDVQSLESIVLRRILAWREVF